MKQGGVCAMGVVVVRLELEAPQDAKTAGFGCGLRKMTLRDVCLRNNSTPLCKTSAPHISRYRSATDNPTTGRCFSGEEVLVDVT